MYANDFDDNLPYVYNGVPYYWGGLSGNTVTSVSGLGLLLNGGYLGKSLAIGSMIDKMPEMFRCPFGEWIEPNKPSIYIDGWKYIGGKPCNWIGSDLYNLKRDYLTREKLTKSAKLVIMYDTHYPHWPSRYTTHPKGAVGYVKGDGSANRKKPHPDYGKNGQFAVYLEEDI